MSNTHICPHCGSTLIHRSRRKNVLEKVISAAGVRPYRCDECDARFLRRRIPPVRKRTVSAPESPKVSTAGTGALVSEGANVAGPKSLKASAS